MIVWKLCTLLGAQQLLRHRRWTAVRTMYAVSVTIPQRCHSTHGQLNAKNACASNDINFDGLHIILKHISRTWLPEATWASGSCTGTHRHGRNRDWWSNHQPQDKRTTSQLLSDGGPANYWSHVCISRDQSNIFEVIQTDSLCACSTRRSSCEGLGCSQGVHLPTPTKTTPARDSTGFLNRPGNGTPGRDNQTAFRARGQLL